MKSFTDQLTKCRKHLNELQHIGRMHKIDTCTFRKDTIMVLADFSATCDLRAKATDNCFKNVHAVLCIMIVLHSPRKVMVQNLEGQNIKVRVHECDAWHFFGETLSKGKKE